MVKRFALTLSVLFILLAAAASAPAQATRFRAAAGGGVKVQALDAATAAALTAGGAELIADYGSYQYFRAAPAALTELAGAGLADRRDANRIELHAGAVDTTQAATRAARTRALTATGRSLQLVQFAGPVKPEWRAALEKTGVQVVDYIPHNAYLVYGDAAAQAAVQQLAGREPAVQFTGALLETDRIHPRVYSAAAAAGRSADAGFADGWYQIQLVADPAANADTLAVVDSLKLDPAVRQRTALKYLNVVAKLPGDGVTVLSFQPDVISIRPHVTPRKYDERQDMIVAGQIIGNEPSGPGYLAWLAARGFNQAQFDASGLVVDVTDSGLDNGTTSPNHFGLYAAGNTALASRVAYARLEGSANSGSTLQGCDGHGTLNAHIVGGYVGLVGSPHVDSSGYLYGLGVCPFVRVGSSVIFDPADFTSPDYTDLAARAFRDGARVSGNSWGADTYGDYDIDAQEYDGLVRDAQPAGAAVVSNGNQQMTFVFAAGNAGYGQQTVGSPGTAKNVITAGAAENVHSHATTNGGNTADGSDGCGTPDSEADSINDVASFSSRGPCLDLRRKPELQAPGTHITGGVAQQNKTMAGTGNDLACFTGEGVCALPGGGTAGSADNFFPSGQQFYSTSSGTSHSTPAIAGGAALVHQWFINQFGNPPSPAMIKAYLVAAARYMNGDGANDTLPSNSQGFGLMDLGFAFDPTPRLLRDQVTNELFTASGQTRTYVGVIASNSRPVRVTLTWTDAPGSTSGNAYNNDLDLVVSCNGRVYHGNVFSGAFSVAGGTADPRNNTESVFLPAGTTGAVSILVRAANINSDGVPNFGTALDQDFALVAYNVATSAVPAVASAGTALTAESCGSGQLDPDEAVTVRLALANVGAASTTNVVATLLAGGGVTAPGAAQAYGALAAGGAAVTNVFTFTATGACGGTVTATWTLQDGAVSLGTVVETFTLGGSVTNVRGATNSASITIVDEDQASVYPSTINLTGLTGTIRKVTATLRSLSHDYVSDMDVVLVSPTGQKVVLMGAAGVDNAPSGITLTFDDNAATVITDTIGTGTYKPSGGVISMPGAGPAAPYATELAAFNGQSPNGAWKLYIADAATGDSGTLSQGWSLRIETELPACCLANQPPVLAPIGDRAVVWSNTLSFAVSATDPVDGDPITLSVSNAPLTATFGATNGAGTFTWADAGPLGVYTCTFYAVDNDGAAQETILITVGDGSCTSSNLLTEPFSTASAPAGWTDGGSANDAVATHYQSPTNCRAMGSGDTLTTPAVDFPTQLVFYVDASSGGDGLSATVEYAVGAGAFATLGTFQSAQTGSNVTFALTSSPDLSASAAVKFRFRSTYNTWYLDDVIIDGGCSGVPVDTNGYPAIAITTTPQTVANGIATFDIGGTANTNVTGLLSWTNPLAGSAGTVAAAPAWLISSVPLAVGANPITVRGTNAAGVAATSTVTITRQAGGGGDPGALTNILFQGFEPGDGWNIVNGAAQVSTNRGPSDTPANQRVRTDVYSWQSSNASNTLDLAAASIAGYTGRQARLRLSSTSATAGNGAETADVVRVYAALDGAGFAATPDLKVTGSSGNNSRWGFWATNTLSTDAGTPVTYTSPQANQSSNNVSTLIIRLPDSASQLALRVIALNSDANERWNVDDIEVSGYAVGGPDPDSDDDGVEDAWEQLYFTNLVTVTTNSDFDADGFLDLHEFLAGSNPTDPQSLLEATGAAPAGGGLLVRWQSESNKLYRLSRAADPRAGYEPIASNLLALPPLNTYTDAAPTNAVHLYRIELQ
jgi:subtilisin-like proprotein convertase family protein